MAYGDVLLVDLPPSNGREQSGRRPTVVVQSNTANEPTLIVAPVTSNLRTHRFTFSVRVEPTAENGLTVPSVVLVFQLRAVDKTRIVRKLGQLSESDLALIEAALWEMLPSSKT